MESILKINGYEELKQATFRWVAGQRRDPEQAIKSICAELMDIRTIPMFLSRLSEEKAIKDEKEMQKILSLIGTKNLRALGYLLRAHLLLQNTAYSSLREDIKREAKEGWKRGADAIEKDIYSKWGDRIKMISKFIYGTESIPEELRNRVKRWWIEEEIKGAKKHEKIEGE